MTDDNSCKELVSKLDYYIRNSQYTRDKIYLLNSEKQISDINTWFGNNKSKEYSINCNEFLLFKQKMENRGILIQTHPSINKVQTIRNNGILNSMNDDLLIILS